MTKLPAGFSTITPNIVVSDCAAAMALYEKALGAETHMKMDGPDGKIIHASMKIGDAMLFLQDDFEFLQRHAPAAGSVASAGLFVYVDNCDAAFKRAVEAGMTSFSEPEDMFWGDRTGTLSDPFGYMWTLAEFQKEMTQEAIDEARKQAGF
jgi:uncharacterized glyoxalase superfamily protein PhnB